MTNATVTRVARKKMVQARAGVKSLPKIAGFVFGTGGINSAGAVITPSESQTKLNNEKLRKPYDKCEMISDVQYRYTVTLSETELADENISEIGLYDTAGDIVAIKNFKAKGKDSDMEMTFMLDDIF